MACRSSGHTIWGNQTFVLLKKHSIDLYRELAADPEFPINYHITGGMRLAHNEDQMDIYRHYVQMAKGVGIDFELIDGAEAGRRHKLMTSDGLLGAWWILLMVILTPHN